jgi:type IV pilus assembly protein PilY1
MTTTRTQPPGSIVARHYHVALRFGAVAAGCALSAGVIAGQTDLSTVPLITSAPQVVKPNLMFIMDDSGSMAWTHMPDTADQFARTGAGVQKYGYVSAQCNGVYYNPSTTYAPPAIVDASGAVTYYPNADFTAAKFNGYDALSTTVDLRSKFRAWSTLTVASTAIAGTTDVEQRAYYYTYSGSQTTPVLKNYFNTAGTFYTECNSTLGSSPGSSVFTRVNIADDAAERTNFANWYSYYRTRMLMMKTSTGLAFRTIGNQFRVGYMSINNNVDPSFLNISEFDGTQKSSWYSKLYGATPNNSTPLREALSNAGRMFAGEKTTMYGVTVSDPIQYSCQKNFALLSTDGYWNGNAGFQLDGSTAVGNQDASAPRPYNDGGIAADVYTATLEVSANNSTDNVSDITVNGAKILSGTADASGGGGGSRSSKLASKIVANINSCTASISGNCTVAGYKAVRSGTTITITAPASAGAITVTPSVAANGGASVTATAFSGVTVTSGGTLNTLADVAMYYYSTDLRTTGTVATNNVLPGGDDDATWQHMTTFTLGLGARGRMIYSSTYKSDTVGDYYAVKSGSTASSSECTWQTAGTVCNWPTPNSSGTPENIDDLWHAAVNGRGQYFSATDPSSLATGLNAALQAVTAITSDSAAATTSNPNVTAGDNYLFSSTFRSAEWYGELEKFVINPSDGTVSTTPDWRAAALLDANTSRTIYTFDAAASTKLKSFEWGNLSTGEQAYFTTAYVQTATPPLNQFCASGTTCLSAANQTAAGGAPLVDFLRGQRTNEGAAEDITKYFRQRAHVLGDIVNSEAVYVKGPVFDYVDAGYAAFKTAKAGRTTMVYVGANDGMLHAFNATTGAEAWAYIPSMLLPKLYRLADKFYSSNHQFYVDGSPTVGDVRFADGTWHTILVGGLNGGGRGYYALDITVPESPKALWEFSTANSANLGLTYGRPEITKLANGTWTVMFTSGYNNVSPGDGNGYLYVVNAETGPGGVPGAPIHAISTGVGSDTAAVAGICATAPCPSGLAQIRAWVENTRFDNTTLKVYGGDLYGNVWRFDVNGTLGAAGVESQLLATLRGPTPANAVQSITAKPELGNVGGLPVVFVGTGRYLGGTDLSNMEVQSIYAVKDSGVSIGNPRSDLGATGFVQQTLTTGTCGTSDLCVTGLKVRTLSTNPVNFATQKGWFVDLPGAGERANTDPQLSLGTLAVVTNILDPSACSVGGESYINFFDYRTGQAVQSAQGIGSVYLGAALGTRPNLFKTTDGKYRWVVDMSDTSLRTGLAPPPTGSGTRRTSWRELIVQ